MKKRITAVVIAIMTILISGCVKLELSSDIGRDKSMDLSITLAVEESLLMLMDEELFTEEDIQQLIESGFTVEDYLSGGYAGKKMSIALSDLDALASDDDMVKDSLDFTELLDNGEFFQVKKGIFKNQYTVNFSIDLSDEEDLESVEDYIDLFDLQYKLHLPVKASSCNGTLAGNRDGGYDYVWKLSPNENNVIQYSFKMNRYDLHDLYTRLLQKNGSASLP